LALAWRPPDGNPENAEKPEKNEGSSEPADDTIGGSTSVARRHMPPKPSRSASQSDRTDDQGQPGTGAETPQGPDPLDLAERLFGPDPSQDARFRAGDGEEGLRVRSKPLWVRLLGFELPWRRRKRAR
jgi:hypothetical protein